MGGGWKLGLGVVVFAALVLGGAWWLTRDDELPLPTANQVTRNWGRIVLTCSADSHKPSPKQLRAAHRSLGVLITQYGRTPNGRAQLVESSDTHSMRQVLESVAERDPGDAAACEPIRQSARAALDYEP